MADAKADDLILRFAAVEDLEYFDQIAATVQFDVGLHNWRVYFSICPEKFQVYVDPKSNKIVGILTGNVINDKFFWGHQIVILPEYRNKHRFLSIITQIDQPYYGGNRNHNSIHALRSLPCYFGHKQIAFYGRFLQKQWSVVPPKGVRILQLDNNPSLVDPKLLQNLYKYDEALYKNFPAPKRRLWLNQWLFPEDPKLSISVVAYNVDDFSVCGFGIGRYQSKFFSLSPVYADSDEIAYALFCAIVNQLKFEDVYMEFDATRRVCFQFAKDANMAQVYSNFRVYIPFVYQLPLEKMYCDNEFWPI